MTVVSVLTLPVRPGASDEFTRLFAELRVFERAHQSGGFLGGRLLRSVSEDGRFLVVADWQSAAHYQVWLDNPVRAELTSELEPMLISDPAAGDLFEEATR